MVNPVVLSGYFGAQNFGDEAMLEYLVQFLQSHGHGAPCALSINPEETHRRHRTSGADSRSLRRKLAALRHPRLLVFGGGELVKNYWPDGGSVVGRALIDVALATALGVPVVVLEVGSEELRNPVGRRYARDILSLAEAVWVRDPTSMHRLSSIGVPQASMKQGADLLFGLDPTISAEDLRPNNGSGPVVALSLPDAELREVLLEAPGRYQAFFHNLAFGVGQLVPQAAGKLVLLGFEANDEANDLNLLDHLARGCPMASPPERV
ncbi:MAG: hypothetical protein FJ315_03975, partial [SAR202 cluster bacterium]|nr:hypothetical protein [SAR202 cluster bacterium]